MPDCEHVCCADEPDDAEHGHDETADACPDCYGVHCRIAAEASRFESLEDALAELERTDADVAAAAVNLDRAYRAYRDILAGRAGRPRRFTGRPRRDRPS
jgi:hypothetical protein